MKFLYEIWRTAFLMGLADQIYRDHQGNLFLVAVDRSSFKPPTRVRRIPSREALRRTMEAICWANTTTLLAILLAVLAIVYAPAPAAYAIVALAFGISWSTRRGVETRLRDYPQISVEERGILVLTKASKLAELRYTTFVKLASIAIALVSLLLPALLHYLHGHDITESEWRLIGAVIGVSIGAALAVNGGHHSYPSRLDLRERAA